MANRRTAIYALIALMFISLVLRPPVASIGPLIPEFISVEKLSLLEVGILTSISVVCFGLGAFAGPWLVKRYGLHRAMMLVLVVLTLAMGLRLLGGFAVLLATTIVIGLMIAIGNVLIPTVVREQFPEKIELITGVYVTLLAISASLAATVAVPSSDLLGSWKGALAIWIIPAVIGILFWIPISRVKRTKDIVTQATHQEERKAVLRSPLTWAIVAFFGLQSTGFYAILNWLPSFLVDRGMTEVEAGGLLGLATFVGVPTGFLTTLVIRKFKSLSGISVFVSVLTLTGLCIVWLSPGQEVMGCIVAGFGFAATFPLSLTLIGSRASTTTQTTQLSSLAQGCGYLIAASGTFLFGELRRLTGNWDASLWMLVILTAIQLVSGFFAGRNRVIPAK
ncbi:MAG: MFS transporter [Microbacteriaceae bacterium]|nr:MFS transporter [Microbacteriaceae bacterium]